MTQIEADQSVKESIPDEHRSWSDSEHSFNNQIRNITIELLVFGILFIISHFQLKYTASHTAVGHKYFK